MAAISGLVCQLLSPETVYFGPAAAETVVGSVVLLECELRLTTGLGGATVPPTALGQDFGACNSDVVSSWFSARKNLLRLRQLNKWKNKTNEWLNKIKNYKLINNKT